MTSIPCSCPICAGQTCRAMVDAVGDVCDFCARWTEYTDTVSATVVQRTARTSNRTATGRAIRDANPLEHEEGEA